LFAICHFTSFIQAPKTKDKYFDALLEQDLEIDTLEDWLSSAPVVTSSDAITWWMGMEAAGDPMARMALNFLSIPGTCSIYWLYFLVFIFLSATSTDVERAFSRGVLTVSKMRHSLSDESTRAASVLGSWWHHLPDAIPVNDIIAEFKEKSKRPKRKEPVTTDDVIEVEST
jgi:hypothetical protein